MKEQASKSSHIQPKVPAVHSKAFRNFSWVSKSVHRHRHVLTFVGALIVFSTYLVKEGKREDLRELIDSTGRAEESSLLRADIRVTDRTILNVYDVLRWDIERDRKQSTGQHTFAAISGAHSELSRDLSDCERVLGITTNLLEQLPTSSRSDIESKVSDYRATITKLRNQFKDIQLGKYLLRDDFQAFVDAEEPTRRSVLSLAHNLETFEAEIFRRAREVREHSEQQYRFWTRASYFLYTLGWSLGLVGRLVGVNAGGED